jgi:hypothetical protein
MVSDHPMGGWPSTRGQIQLKPLPSLRAAMEVGPPSEGIQNHPSVSSPEMYGPVISRPGRLIRYDKVRETT